MFKKQNTKRNFGQIFIKKVFKNNWTENLKKGKTLVRFLSRPVSQTNDCGRKYVGAHIQLTKFSAQKLEKEALEGVIKEEEKEKETINGSFWW